MAHLGRGDVGIPSQPLAVDRGQGGRGPFVLTS